MQPTQYQYLPVHWMDGMKINKSHFIAQNNAYTSQIAQGLGGLLNEYNYGLLPNKRNGGFKLFISTDNQQQVQIRLQQCSAITSGGHVIHFDEQNMPQVNHISVPIPGLSVPFNELKGRTTAYFIILVINPYERIPYGYADPAEMPPRLPYTLPAYSLALMPEQETNSTTLGDFQFPVGKLKVLEQKVMLDEEYIPPCTSVSSHTDLLEIHAGLEHFFSKMESHALQIIQKILQKKQANDMAAIVQRLCEQITFFTATHLSNFKMVYLQQPPVCMINTVSAFARTLKNILDFYIGSGKEELFKYLKESCDINQAELEGAITLLANHSYSHLQINDSIEKITVFTNLFGQLLIKLAKLEYIGKRKDSGIFVNEHAIETINAEPEIQPKKRKSFLVE